MCINMYAHGPPQGHGHRLGVAGHLEDSGDFQARHEAHLETRRDAVLRVKTFKTFMS